MNSHVSATDYVVELDHEGGKGLLMHKDKIAVFVQTSGDSIFSESTLSVGGSVKDACAAILGHWAAHESELKSASAATHTQKVEPVASVVTASPVSVAKPSVTVASTPSGADIEINGSFVGNTPSVIERQTGRSEHSHQQEGLSTVVSKAQNHRRQHQYQRRTRSDSSQT